MSRHVCDQHSEEMSQFGGEAPSQANVLLRNLESSTSESSESELETPFLCDPEEDSRRSLFVRAAAEILDRHQDFSEKSLLRFLAESFPDIEKSQRLPLLIGAFSGAQFVSSMHFYAVHCSSSDDPRYRRAARNANAAISNWNLGLRVGTRPTLLMQYPSRAMAADDVSITSSALRVISPSPTSSPKRFRCDNLHLPVECRQASGDSSADRCEATPVISSPLAELTARFLYDEPAASGFQSPQEGTSAQAPPSSVNRSLSTGGASSTAGQHDEMDGQISRLGSSGQTLPFLSRQAQGQRDGTGGQASHGGSNGQVLPSSSGQAQGQRDGTGGQASHRESNGRVLPSSGAQAPPLVSGQAYQPCSGRQSFERLVIADLVNRSTPSPEWSAQALPVSSNRHSSTAAPTTAGAAPWSGVQRGARPSTKPAPHHPSPILKIPPHDASTPGVTTPVDVTSPPRQQRSTAPRTTTSSGYAAEPPSRDQSSYESATAGYLHGRATHRPLPCLHRRGKQKKLERHF